MASVELQIARRKLREFRRLCGGKEPKPKQPRKPRAPIYYRGIDIAPCNKKEKARFAIDLFLMGCSRREVHRKTGLYDQSLRPIVRRIKAAGMMPTFCMCGGKAGHRGWCSERLKRSARRQAVLAKMHQRQRRTKL